MNKTLYGTILIVMAMISSSAFSDSYRPPIAKFDGTGGPSFPSDLSLQFSNNATIEFWLAATWKDIDYTPVVLSYTGDQGPRFSALIASDRKGLGFMSEQDWVMVPFDFSDGKIHHVALVIIDDETNVIIDNRYISTLPIGIADVPAHSLNIGSLNGTDYGFIGVITGLRVWNIPLDPDDIQRFSRIPLDSQIGLKHPSLTSLVGLSNAIDGEFVFQLINEPITIIEGTDDDLDIELPADIFIADTL